MDHNIFLAINNLAGKLLWLDAIGTFIGSDWFLYLFALIVATVGLKKIYQHYVVISLVSAVFAHSVLSYALKHFIYRARPFEILTVHQLITSNERGNSFPSGHATFYFALGFAFWGTPYFWPFLGMAVLGSLGRVFVGVHFPLDILAGALIGAATGLVFR